MYAVWGFSCCTSPEGGEIECFVDKMVVIVVRGSSTCGGSPLANDRTIISVASFE